MINSQPVTVYLGLGSNLEDRQHHLDQADGFPLRKNKNRKNFPDL